MIKKIICFILIAFSLSFTQVYADNGDLKVDIKGIEDVSKKIQQDNNYMPNLSFSNIVESYKRTGSLKLTLNDFFKMFILNLFREIAGNSRLMIELLFLGILCALLQNIQSAFASDNVSKIAYYACFLLMVVIIIKSFVLTVDVGRETISNMVEFTNALIPSLLTMLTAIGGIASAATLDPILLLVIKITSDVIRDFVLPVTVLVVVLNIVDSLSDEIKITKLALLIKQINQWILGIIMTAFIAFITIRSSISATLDQVTLKTAKFAVDNFIPVIGKCLSDAITTVAGYTLILKDAVSIAGLIIMIFICLMPLIKILIIALIYKFVGAVMEPIVDKKIVGCLSSTGDSLSIVFACILSVGIMFFIMITIISSTGRLITLVR